jgi:hypothetical protein
MGIWDGGREDWEARERRATHDARIGTAIALALALLALAASIVAHA